MKQLLQSGSSYRASRDRKMRAGSPQYFEVWQAASLPPSSQFQSRQAEESEKDRQDQKAKDNLRLFPTHHFKMMVQRRHLENAPTHTARALRHFKHRDLQHHRQSLDHEHTADHQQHEFLFGQHGDSADSSADGQTAYVARKHLRRRR